MLVKFINMLSVCFLLSSCTSTKITQSWVESENQKSYIHPMIIGISDSQQTRQIYEKHFVEELSKKNISATPSYMLISSKQKINSETVLEAIKDTDIDSVLLTYLVSADTELKHHDSPVSGNYSSESDNLMSATMITVRGRTSDTEIIDLKNDLYDAVSKNIIWSVQTRSVAPASIDEVIMEVTDLLIDQLFSDNLLK